VRFAQTHNFDIAAIVRRLNTKPFIRVEAGAFIGYLEGQRYWLGSAGEELSRRCGKWSGFARKIG